MITSWLLLLTFHMATVTAHANDSLVHNHKIGNYTSAEEYFHHMNLHLYEHLMHDYARELSPYYTNHRVTGLPASWRHPAPMNTDLTLVFARLIKVDQVEQVMKMLATLRMVWRDYRLAWKPADFGGIEHIYVGRSKIWVPEIFVANSEYAVDTAPDYKQNVLINYTGHVHFYYNVVSNSVCRLETNDFPFDEQKGNLCLIETFFNKNESTINAELSKRFSYKMAGNGEWDVVKVNIHRMTIPDYERVEFDLMCFEFTMKRKANFYVMVIIIPTFIITTLTITGIFGKRITRNDFIGELSLGLTSLMTMTVMLGIVADSLPKTNHLPVLSIFLTVDVSLMALSVLIVIVHPRILYPKFRKIRSKIIREPEEGEAKRCCCGLLPPFFRQLRCSANIIFMMVFQFINIANLLYILSHWN